MKRPLEYQAKKWGRTVCLGVYNDVMVWQAFIDHVGEQTSIHHHEHDYNEIDVVSGRLRINYFNNPPAEPIEVEEIGPGERVVINPQVVHQFEVLEAGVIIELYWRDHHFDIVRHA